MIQFMTYQFVVINQKIGIETRIYLEGVIKMILENWSEEAKQTVDNFSPKEKERLNAIIAMNIMVCNMNDESAYFTWIYLVPDCADEDDFIDFARNDEETEENKLFDEAVELFKKLWKNYAIEENGLYIAAKTY